MFTDKDFLVLRYSLIQEDQSTIDPLSLPHIKGQAAVVAIEQDRDFTINGVTYGLVGFAEARLSEKEPSRYYIGKLAKHRRAHIGKKVPRDILDTIEDDWVPILVIFDTHSQHIVVQKDWRFGAPDQTVRCIQHALREPISSLYGYRVFVEGKTRKEAFWNVIRTHRKIYKLDLRLISPNILETNRAARDALEALQDLFAQDEVQVALVNEEGALKVPPQPISGYLEYIQEGEGSWTLTTDGKLGGKKRHSSSDSIDVITLSVPPPAEEFGADRPSQISLSPEEGPRALAKGPELYIVEQVAEALDEDIS